MLAALAVTLAAVMPLLAAVLAGSVAALGDSAAAAVALAAAEHTSPAVAASTVVVAVTAAADVANRSMNHQGLPFGVALVLCCYFQRKFLRSPRPPLAFHAIQSHP